MPLARQRLLAILAISQIVGWGTSFDLLGVIGRRMAADLGLSNETAMLGVTVMLVLGGLAAPATGRALARHGAARVMAVGSLLFGLGLFGLAAATGLFTYLAAWAVIGLAGSLALSLSAYAAVVEREGADAKRVIGLLMIFTGLSSAVSWPVASAAEAAIGWRWTLVSFGLLHLLVLAPLHRFGLPQPLARGGDAMARAERAPLTLGPARQRHALVALIVVNLGFSGLTFGLSPSLIALLQTAGAEPGLALQLGAARAVLGIGARALDTLAGQGLSPMASGLAATGLIGAAFLLLALGKLATAGIALFVLLYGIGSGLSVVARTVLPLSFFSASRFAAVSARIALPTNLVNAVAPVIVTALLDRGGLAAVIAFALAMTGLVLAALVCLTGLRRRALASAETGDGPR